MGGIDVSPIEMTCTQLATARRSGTVSTGEYGPLMRRVGRASASGELDSLVRRGRHRSGRRPVGAPAAGKVFGAVLSAVLVILTGFAWMTYHRASSAITTSAALDGTATADGEDQNILIMGLDSRRDQHGQPLSQDVLDAMHAGDETSGDYDADVLIVVHMPADGGPVTAISIPRDDYIHLPGCPASDCRGKIKEAYRLAYEEVTERPGDSGGESSTAAADAPDVAAREQLAREAGRRAQIGAVEYLLQIPIHHFVEVTLAAFFHIAQVVEPIEVCLTQDTSDPYYSGADFREGVQQIDASEAMAFVRQRRDVDDALFSDLDRTRRQQAFMASIVSALRSGGALWNPGKLNALLQVAQRNVAINDGLRLQDLIAYARKALDRPVEFYTLPVTEFRTTPYGEDVNIVDVATIRSVVEELLGSGSTASPVSKDDVGPDPAAADPVTLNVVNASGEDGVAVTVRDALAKGQLTEGAVTTADWITGASSIVYGAGAQFNAELLGDELGLSATASDAIAPGTVLLTVGTDLRAADDVDGIADTSTATTTTGGPIVTTVPATADDEVAPAPTDLTVMTAEGVPCVR